MWNRIRQQFGPLETRLFLIVLASLMPLILLTFFTLYDNAQNQKRNLIPAVQNTLQAIVASMDAEIGIAISALDALAASPRLQAGDFAAFHAEAKELLERRPYWVNVVLCKPDTTQIINAQVPYGQALPSGVDVEGIATVVRNGKADVGNLIVSPVFKKYLFPVRMPIRINGRVEYVLIAAIDPKVMHQLLRLERLPEGAGAAIVDRNYDMVARTGEHEKWVGKRASPGLVQMVQNGDRMGWTRTTTSEPRWVYGFYHRSDLAGWTVAIGIPTEVIDGPMHRSYALLAGSIFFAVLLGLIVAFLVGRSIIHSVKQLEHSALDMGQGNTPAVPETDLHEIRSVGLALYSAFVEREALLDKERVARAEESKAREAAESANKAKDEFLAMLGHELRNPLAPIATAAQLLTLRQADASRLDRLSAIIQRQSDHLTRLVDDLLDVSRVTSKRIVLKKEAVDLNSILPEAVEQVQELIEARNHALQVVPAPEPAWVRADRTRLVQIVVNLLHNAARYTPESGEIRLAVELAGDQVALTVADNGTGIAADMLPHVFELFQQGARTPDREQGGLGLGLSLVKGLIELHGGSITASSAGPGCGSTFRFELRRVMPLMAEHAPSRLVASSERPLRVAVVDDNVDAGQTLADYLQEGCGYAVTFYSDPLQALEDADHVAYDAYILDIGMPGMDGHTLARRLRAHAMTANAILIAVSGYGLEQDRRNSREAGIDHHLSKPVNMAALGALLQGVMREGHESTMPSA